MSTKEKPVKLYNVLPLRNKIVPCYITIDTACIVHLFVEENKLEYMKKLGQHKEELWNKVFKFGKKVFRKKGHDFGYMIKTDGIGVSLLFSKVGINNHKIKEQYIEEQINIAELIGNKKVGVIDPNYGNLIYCVHMELGKTKKFRYTQRQRDHETKRKKYNKKIDKKKSNTMIRKYFPMKMEELKLSRYNSKSCVFFNFERFLHNKNIVNKDLFGAYQDTLYRKLKWYGYINRQKSESNMVNNFKEKVGNPEETIVIMGDFDKKSNMKGKEPAKIKGLRKVLRNGGYKVYLINEFRTSKLCNKCCSEVENFKEKSDGYLEWSLVRCTNVDCRPESMQNNLDARRIYNRDQNACMNMLKIVKNLIRNGVRPIEYCRSNS